MILNEILSKQSILNAILVKSDDAELNKDLKVKIVRLRIAYNKIRQQFEKDLQKFLQDLIPEEGTLIQNKPENERTPEETNRLQEITAEVNAKYVDFIKQKYAEDYEFTLNDSFSESDFDEIIGINAGNEVEINGTKILAEHLMESFYTLFVNSIEK